MTAHFDTCPAVTSTGHRTLHTHTHILPPPPSPPLPPQKHASSFQHALQVCPFVKREDEFSRTLEILSPWALFGQKLLLTLPLLRSHVALPTKGC